LDHDPIQRRRHHNILELLYNKKNKYGRFVMENVFKILKNNCKFFFTKFDLPISFVHDAFTSCCLLHNLLRSQIETNVERLMRIIVMELLQNLELEMAHIVIDVAKKQTSHSIDGKRFGKAMHM
jgi:hypothetical protein